LTGAKRPEKYWGDIEKKLKNESNIELSEKIGQLRLIFRYGKHKDV
jgi:hypothetical protein